VEGNGEVDTTGRQRRHAEGCKGYAIDRATHLYGARTYSFPWRLMLKGYLG